MVTIFCNTQDLSSSKVMDWLGYYDVPVQRLNTSNDVFKKFSIDELQTESFIHKSVWIRKKPPISFPDNLPSEWLDIIKKQMQEEYDIYWNTIFDRLRSSNLKVLCPLPGEPSKPLVLELCKIFNVSIPPTIITSHKHELVSFINEHQASIVKPLSNPFFFQDNNTVWASYTTRLTPEFVSSLPDVFFPCLVQKEIVQRAEIRAFYLHGKFYSMCQFVPQTATGVSDSRKYTRMNQSRCVCYKLPFDLEEKLTALMDSLALNTGSLDLLLSQEGEHFFLEVNPFGQFDSLSCQCNYHIEKQIAQYLIKND